METLLEACLTADVAAAREALDRHQLAHVPGTFAKAAYEGLGRELSRAERLFRAGKILQVDDAARRDARYSLTQTVRLLLDDLGTAVTAAREGYIDADIDAQRSLLEAEAALTRATAHVRATTRPSTPRP